MGTTGLQDVTGTLVDVLVAATTAAVLVVWGRALLAARRRSVRVEDVRNGSGDAGLDAGLDGVSAALRHGLRAELRQVGASVAHWRQRVRTDSAEAMWALELPDMGRVASRGQDETMQAMLASLETGAPRSVGVQLQALSELVARPRGATVTATVVSGAGGVMGLALEVVGLSGGFSEDRVWWEPDAGRGPATARVTELARPAARWAAVMLAAWALGRGGHGRRGRRRWGVAANEVGLLLKASATGQPQFADDFLELAARWFEDASDALPGSFKPVYQLATTWRDRARASRSPAHRADWSARAVDIYDAAADMAGADPVLSRRALPEIEMARTLGQLLADGADVRQQAVRWLDGQPQAIHDGRPGRSLYNEACTWAVGARVTGRVDWAQHARRLLGCALGTSDRPLWDTARHDPDLAELVPGLDGFEAALHRERSDHHATDRQAAAAIVDPAIVDDAIAASHWGSPPPAAVPNGPAGTRRSTTEPRDHRAS